jgi:subtilisin family serine protease
MRAAASEYFRSRFGVSTLRRFKNVDIDRVKLPEDMSVEEAVEIYRNDPDVEYVEPNYRRYATATIPDDPFFSNLWGLDNGSDNDIDAPEAWDIATGSDNEVVVAVLDSGAAWDHPDLAANIWTNPVEIAGNGIDDDGNGYVDDVRGWDFVDDDNNPMDNEDHGTHVAGTIAAVGNNNTGITGVTWTAKIMVLRFLDGFGVGSVADEIEAIDYAIDKGARVINASFGSSSSSTPERTAIDNARVAGILFVAAAGNDGLDNDGPIKNYPSSYNLANIVAVAASDQNDNLALFSDFGATTVDVAAPGTSTYSAKPPDRTISVFSDNFEGGTGNWNLDPPWGLSSDIFFSGSNSLADSPGVGVNYGNNIDVAARNNNALGLVNRSRARLSFMLRGKSGDNDLLFVETAPNVAGPWTNRNVIVDTSQTFEDGIFGNSSGQWVDGDVELDILDGSNGYFRFRFQTDANSDSDDGWYIDDVEISAADATYPDPQSQYYQFHVAGLAALIWSLDLGQTYTEVKERILNSVEVKSGLAGLLLTGGRINAYNSIRNVPTAPSSLSAKAASGSQVDLTWSDNSFGEDGFRIERKIGAAGIYVQITVTAANATTYSDTGLQESTTYFYRISSFNGGNDSDYSAETSATPRSGGGGGGSCFIATAAFGSPLHDHVAVLKDFRARFLFTNRAGRMFVGLYNSYSPPLADFIRKHESVRIVIRWMLYPVVGLAWILLHTSVAVQTAMILSLLCLTYIVVFRKGVLRKSSKSLKLV